MEEKEKERASSSLGDAHQERRNSLISNAPSESSRSDFGIRAGHKTDDEKSSVYAMVTQTKNYFQRVSENKEISRLLSLLSTSINSTKKVSSFALQFIHQECYTYVFMFVYMYVCVCVCVCISFCD